MAITVPGKSALLKEQSSLTSQKNTNLAQIATLEAQNAQIDAQQGYITDTLAYMCDLTHLNAPAGFTATVISPTETDLTWENDAKATGYVVEQAENENYTGASEIHRGAYGTIHVTGLTTGVNYHWRVKAIAPSRDDSDWSTVSVIPT